MRSSIFFILLSLSLLSCSTPKEGCPTNGKNVGAEKLMNDDPRKGHRYKAPKFSKKLSKF